MTELKMTDHQNCRTWNCRTWKWRTKFAWNKTAKPDNTEHCGSYNSRSYFNV